MTKGNEVLGSTLVTGASGFIGQHLVETLLGRNRPVIACGRRLDPFVGIRNPLLRVSAGDLRNPDSYVLHLNSELTVFHLAAARIQNSLPQSQVWEINFTACLEFARACLKARVRKFVYVSTALVFGPSHGKPLTEAAGLWINPGAGPYFETKARALQEMRRMAGDGMPIVTVCPTIVYGPDKPLHSNRVYRQVRHLLRSRLNVVVGGGDQKRNLVYVDDVVNGILLAESRGRHGQEYILGGEDTSHLRLNRTVFSVMGLRPRLSVSIPASLARVGGSAADFIRGHPRNEGYAQRVRTLTSEWQYSSEKAKRELGYRPTPLEEGMRKTLKSLGEERQ